MDPIIKDRDRWEAFAIDNAEAAIDDKFSSYPADKRKKVFLKGGQDSVVKSLARVDALLPDYERVLEIGAGVGRLTLPHARSFEEVIAVDISPTMLEKLQENAKDAALHNIRTFLPEENWDADPVSYAYSYLVLQHIVDFDAITQYIKRIAGCLKRGGVAELQFDTREPNILYKIRNKIPDFLLPKSQIKGIRRIRRDADNLRQVFQKNDMEIEKEIRPNSTMHTFLLKR